MAMSLEGMMRLSLQEMSKLLCLQLEIATAVRDKAAGRCLHGTCWVMAVPKKFGISPKNGLVSWGLCNPTMVVIGGCFMDYAISTNKAAKFIPDGYQAENYIGVGALKLARMANADQDSEIPPTTLEPIPTFGEECFKGGRVYELGDYHVLIALSSNGPDQNNEIVDKVVREWLASHR